MIKTYKDIMNDMLSRVPDSYDKREGSVIWDALAPAAIELANAYVDIDAVLNETFADTASIYYLKKRAAERGIEQKPASYAIVKAEFTPDTVEISIGARFSCDDVNYEVTEMITAGVYKMQCETLGTEGNAHIGTIIPIDYISGLETANITEVLVPAEDAEDVESLRARYFGSINSQAFGGNIADYKEKVNAISGVGGVKVTPVWNGGGTVKLTIIDSNNDAPSEELVDTVQQIIDPTRDGQGVGIAPIGHIVTVVGATSKYVDISATITYATGWSWTTAKPYIEAAIDNLFEDLAEDWEDTDAIVVRLSAVTSTILNCAGVVDISNTKLNGVAANLQLTATEIPVRRNING